MVKNLKCIFGNIKDGDKISRKPRHTYIIYNNTIMKVDLETLNRQNYQDDKGRSR